MRIAIVTANFGKFDVVHPVKEQNIECEYYNFTEETSPFPLAGLNDRMKAKWFKILNHKRLWHDVIIWHDGSIKIESPDFAQYMLGHLDKSKIAIPLHPKRPNVEEELLFIMEAIKGKDAYLSQRYNATAIRKELEFLRATQMHELPLYACGLFAFRNTEGMRKIFEYWWEMILKFSEFDQCMFSYCFKDLPKGVFPFEDPFKKKLISRTEHKK